METVVKLASVAATVLATLGGFEFIKWVVTRKYGKRVDEAEADKSEFGALREQVIFLQEQLLKKEEVCGADHAPSRPQSASWSWSARLRCSRLSVCSSCARRMCGERMPQSGY